MWEITVKTLTSLTLSTKADAKVISIETHIQAFFEIIF